jgi:hypothetical protein
MSEICEFCNKTFNSKYTLNNHIKTAKYCINIRKNNNIETTELSTFDCNFCYKTFTSNESLKKHLIICIENCPIYFNASSCVLIK